MSTKTAFNTTNTLPVAATIPENFDTTIVRIPKISTGITKLGVNIPSINLPPVITCRADAPCAKCAEQGGGCYALKGHWLYTNVRNTVWNNLYAYRQNPKLFFDTITIDTALASFVRWFSSGDIVDTEFLKGMCCVARKNKGVKYLCFTKKYELVNEFLDNGGKIPSNLKIIFSTWGNFIPENPHNLPMTYVRFSEKSSSLSKEKKKEVIEMNSKIPESAIPCTGACYKCQACWSLKRGQSVCFKKH